MENEIWKPVIGYEGLYEVSNTGRVKSLGNAVLKTVRILKLQHRQKNGYLFVRLSNNGKIKACYVHRLVAEAFLNNSNNYPIVNHIDENKENNNVSNLEWCTVSHNTKHSYDRHPTRKTEIAKKCFVDSKTGRLKSSYSQKGIPHKNKQKVALVNDNWEIIKIFDNPSYAASVYGVSVSNLVTTCKKNKEKIFKHKTDGKIFVFLEG